MMVSNGTLTGNYAYHDSLTALRWIKENIASFGGDAERITIFGMSSGAALTAFISGMLGGDDSESLC